MTADKLGGKRDRDDLEEEEEEEEHTLTSNVKLEDE